LFNQPWNKEYAYYSRVLNWRNIISKIKERNMFI